VSDRVSALWKYLAIVSTVGTVFCAYVASNYYGILASHERSTLHAKLYPGYNIYELKWYVENNDPNVVREVINYEIDEAKKGSAQDNWVLGYRYAYGIGVERNRKMAKKHFIDSGNPWLIPTFEEIYIAYKNGKSLVAKNDMEAQFWHKATEEQKYARR